MPVYTPAMAPDYRIGLGGAIAAGIGRGVQSGLSGANRGIAQEEERRRSEDEQIRRAEAMQRQIALQDAAVVPGLGGALGGAIGGGGGRGRSSGGGGGTGGGAYVPRLSELAQAPTELAQQAAVMERITEQEAELAQGRMVDAEAQALAEDAARRRKISELQDELMAQEFAAEQGQPRASTQQAQAQQQAAVDRGLQELPGRIPGEPSWSEFQGMWREADAQAREELTPRFRGDDPTAQWRVIPDPAEFEAQVAQRREQILAMSGRAEVAMRGADQALAQATLERSHPGAPSAFPPGTTDEAVTAGLQREAFAQAVLDLGYTGVDLTPGSPERAEVDARAERLFAEELPRRLPGNRPEGGLQAALARLQGEQAQAQARREAEQRGVQTFGADAGNRAAAQAALQRGGEALSPEARQHLLEQGRAGGALPAGLQSAFEQAQRAATARKVAADTRPNPAVALGLPPDTVIDPQEMARAAALQERTGDTSGWRMLGVTRPPKKADLPLLMAQGRAFAERLQTEQAQRVYAAESMLAQAKTPEGMDRDAVVRIMRAKYPDKDPQVIEDMADFVATAKDPTRAMINATAAWDEDARIAGEERLAGKRGEEARKTKAIPAKSVGLKDPQDIALREREQSRRELNDRRRVSVEAIDRLYQALSFALNDAEAVRLQGLIDREQAKLDAMGAPAALAPAAADPGAGLGDMTDEELRAIIEGR